RLGKTVLELDEVWAGYDDTDVLRAITWNIAPGERTGIVAANGQGKTTLLRVLEGSLEPTQGHIKRGKTVKIGSLDQRDGGLEPWWDKRVADLVADHKTSYVAGKAEYTPSYLLEQLGFASATLSQQVSRLSGGQRRRLNILVQLLAEPNVLLLDEPTNDLDTDMLTALEDLLDSWPGTLIVVSHDRYLVERVTDQQYALIDGRLRHLPRGIDEYLQLRPTTASNSSDTTPSPDTSQKAESKSASSNRLQPGSKEHRVAEKERGQMERRLAKLQAERATFVEQMAAIDPREWEPLSELTQKVEAIDQEISEREVRWLQLGALLEPKH
ncbi:MAG: ATP-binding cassette domain-containing protein, partial [Pontimonas sp.]